jgi:hypothetical protein
VERGDYQVLRAEDSRMINRSEFHNTIKPDMILEMTIVMRESTTLEENRGKCPRCYYANFNPAVSNGWIEWKVLHFTFCEGLQLTQVPTVPNAHVNSRSPTLI